ncbi:MAG: hypothetical protein K2I29_04925 [Clostridia bacterium]|nr:hypothetical protein [Clostridia bacterium]
MEKNGLIVFIFELLCGLVCIGLGIYYFSVADTTKAVVFLLVGAVCIVMAVRALLCILRNKKNKDDKDKK